MLGSPIFGNPIIECCEVVYGAYANSSQEAQGSKVYVYGPL